MTGTCLHLCRAGSIALACLSMLAACGERDATAPASTAAPASTTAQSRAAVEDYARLLTVERDVAGAMARYFGADLIQHDALIGDGGHGDEEFLANRRERNPEQFLPEEEYHTVVDNVLADGELVALKSHVYTNPKDPGRAFLDMWRVADGEFVEHWDVIQTVPQTALNDATMWCGGAGNYAEAGEVGDTVANPGCGRPGPAANRDAALATVVAYRQMSADPLQAAAAAEQYFAENFVQHSTYIAQGKAALIDYEQAQAQTRVAAGQKNEIARIVADGDMVLTHSRLTTNADPRGVAHADLYRVQDGKIVEHWDIIQPIPPFSVAGHSMIDGPLEPGRRVGGPSEAEQ